MAEKQVGDIASKGGEPFPDQDERETRLIGAETDQGQSGELAGIKG